MTDFRKLIQGSTEAERPLDPHYNEVPEIRGTSRTKGVIATGRDAEDAARLSSFRTSEK